MLNKDCFNFSRNNLIRKKEHFKYIFNNSKKTENFYIRVYYATALEEIGKIAVIASKKIGKAVVRNKIKRRVKEIFRQNQYMINRDYDFIFVIKRNLAKESYIKLNNGVLRLFEKNNLLLK